METSGGFSSTVILFIIIIVFAVLFTTSGSQDDHVNDKGGLTADDYGILKAMMDRCMDIYVDPSSPPPMNLQGDGLERVQKLNIFRCNKFFRLVIGSLSEHGKFSPDYVHKLKEEVPNLLPSPSHNKLEEEVPKLSPRLSHKFGLFLDLDDDFKLSFNKTGGALYDDDNHPRVLKPVMEKCVKIYLDYADPEKQKTLGTRLCDDLFWIFSSDIRMCRDFFWRLARFYRYNKDKLAPQHVEILKGHPRAYELNWDDRTYNRCLIFEKHGILSCGLNYCDDIRRLRISKGLPV